jgi:upstream activation factor subunit UAF30
MFEMNKLLTKHVTGRGPSAGTSASKRKRDAPKKSGNKRNQPLCDLSAELSAFLGKKELARTQVVSEMWVYIKREDLQNPDNKREILCDAKLKRLFGKDSFTMFEMNKLLTKHVTGRGPSAGTSASKRKRESSKGSTGSAGPKKRKQTEYALSAALQAVVGESQMSRPQCVKALWVYIREHGLQNPSNKREIICDEKFAKVMGRKKVTMFSMNKFLSNNLYSLE